MSDFILRPPFPKQLLIVCSRGKQVFRKFEDMDAPDYYNEDGIDEAEFDEVLPSSLRGPVTRSTVKPRILFPSEEQKKMRSHKTEVREPKPEDEEADRKDLSAAKGKIDNSFELAAASSPTTTWAARSKHVDLSSFPGAPTSDDEHLRTPPKHNARRTANASPCAELKRSRSAKAKVNKKREGEPLARGGGGKKLRG